MTPEAEPARNLSCENGSSTPQPAAAHWGLLVMKLGLSSIFDPLYRAYAPRTARSSTTARRQSARNLRILSVGVTTCAGRKATRAACVLEVNCAWPKRRAEIEREESMRGGRHEGGDRGNERLKRELRIAAGYEQGAGVRLINRWAVSIFASFGCEKVSVVGPLQAGKQHGRDENGEERGQIEGRGRVGRQARALAML